MEMQSVLCEVGNKRLNIDYFNFRLHRLTQPAIIRCTSVCTGHVNDDHKNCMCLVHQPRNWDKSMTDDQKKKKPSPWKLKRGVRKVGHKVYAESCGSQSLRQSK